MMKLGLYSVRDLFIRRSGYILRWRVYDEIGVILCAGSVHSSFGVYSAPELPVAVPVFT